MNWNTWYPPATRKTTTTTYEYDENGRVVRMTVVEDEYPYNPPVYNPGYVWYSVSSNGDIYKIEQ